VSSQAEALAQPVAKLLAMRTGRSVAWQLIAKSGVNTREAVELLTHRKLYPVGRCQEFRVLRSVKNLS
jgi:hypothetical protein